ncbi:MAG: hypothetical protein LBC20_08835 [Planctomycetaceae bacterium]|jgi:hypothetical protein|nr:hypothetical protein [Planctomycetaceae bacterium]
MNYKYYFVLVLFLVLFACSQASPLLLAQKILNTTEAVAEVKGNPAFCEFPMTVECLAKLTNSNSYNILVANEPKSSPFHWELFTMPKSGYLTLYASGFSPDHIRTEYNVVDGQYHYLAAIITPTSIALYVDGEKKTHIDVKAPVAKVKTSHLRIGTLVEGGLGCKGEIAEIRISRGEKSFSGVTKLLPENGTIALWDFSQESEGVYSDLSGNKNNAVKFNFSVPEFMESARISAPFIPLFEPPNTEPAKHAAGELLAKLPLQLPALDTVRDVVWQEWLYDFNNWNKIEYADKRVVQFDNRKRIPDQVFDRQALILPEDKTPVGTVIRRTEALLNHLNGQIKPEMFQKWTNDLAVLKNAYKLDNPEPNHPEQLAYYMLCCLIRRQLVFQNPLLDFDDLLCVVRGTYAGSVRSNPHTQDAQGGHFVNQYFGFNAIPGGGLYVIKGWKRNSTPQITNLLENSVVQNSRLKGQKLDFGAFCTPDVDFDGKRISFSWCGNKSHELIFSQTRLWHLFSVNVDGSNLTQLTDGAFDDFDSCWLPNGRLAFISERRGGFIRCFAGLVVPQFSLYSMKDDGSDLFPLSYYETSEWNPTINHDGKIVYTRWDYTDRENTLGSRFWICNPDGTDPRAPHGNYPNPWHTFPDIPDLHDSRIGTPRTEMNIRAVPNSPLYLFTAAPHHGDIDGSLCMLDLRIPDDGHMSQIKRVTPEEFFPESEFTARSHFKYKTPFPLSEDFYLCNCWENLVLMDRFGNKELICGLREMPCRQDDRFRVFEPIPLREQTRPPILPSRTNQGEDIVGKDPESVSKATLAVMNVYESDQPLPQGVKIKWLRIVQNVLKSNPDMGDPMIGYERENTPRIPLGIVPVESDGSAYFEAPIAKELIFQILDENRMAVQSMRSVAYVHSGEQLRCTGCHEKNQFVSGSMKSIPLAMNRAPSKIEPELNPIEPISYYRQIKPIFDKTCAECHEKQCKVIPDLSYNALKEDTFWFSGGMSGTVNTDYSGVHGGTRSIPGRFGAHYCKLGRILQNETHRNALPEEIRHRINLWMDCNSLRLTAFHRVGEQLQGKLVWPYLDVDPKNPLGVEGTEPPLRRHFWHENGEGLHPYLCSAHQGNKILICNAQGKTCWEYSCRHPQDVWMLDSGNILAAWYCVVQEIKPDYKSGKGGTVIWEYKTAEPNQIPNCQPLPDGNVMIGIVGECRLIEVNRQGKVVHELKLQTTEKTPHSQFRLARKTPEGTYLVPFTAEGAVREYDADGKIVREFPKMSLPVGVVRLPDGNTLISADGKITEYDVDDKIVWEVRPFEIPDISIGIFAGLQRFPNGNTVVCNWNPQPNKDQSAAHIFEITRDKRVVWQVESNDFGGVAACRILTPDFIPTEEFSW